MAATLQQLCFDGAILQRGFWLYVWEVTTPEGGNLYYVGRTGDSSSTKAQSPFHRMGQHLGFAATSSMLRNHLSPKNAAPESCTFRLVALGPLEQESKEEHRREHDERRDLLAAMEKALADLMNSAGYDVMNSVSCKKELNPVRFAEVREAFTRAFPALAMVRQGKPGAGPP